LIRSLAACSGVTAEETMKQSNPPGWDEERVKKVLAHYESQSDDEAAAEDDAAFENPEGTIMVVPQDLVPAVLALIAEHTASQDRS
jgi:hypothetical protein